MNLTGEVQNPELKFRDETSRCICPQCSDPKYTFKFRGMVTEKKIWCLDGDDFGSRPSI